MKKKPIGKKNNIDSQLLKKLPDKVNGNKFITILRIIHL